MGLRSGIRKKPIADLESRVRHRIPVLHRIQQDRIYTQFCIWPMLNCFPVLRSLWAAWLASRCQMFLWASPSPSHPFSPSAYPTRYWYGNCLKIWQKQQIFRIKTKDHLLQLQHPTKEVRAPVESSSHLEGSSNVKFLHLCYFWRTFWRA